MRRDLFKIPAIVFGGGITGLGVARNLGKECIDVHLVVEGVDVATFSRFCKKKIVVPKFMEKSSLVKNYLKEFSSRTSSRAVIFASDDISTLLLAGLRCEMKDDYYFVLPSLEIAEELISKKNFYESLTRKQIPHPKVVLPFQVDDVRKISAELKFPILIKPSISMLFNRAFGKKAFVANSPAELSQYCSLASKHGIEVICQEIIPGSDKNTFGLAGCFNKESNPLALFAYHRLRAWPNKFGTSSLIESMAVTKYPQLKEIITRYLKSISYSGIMEAEFKLDPRDNRFKLIEVNARSWWQNSLPTECGLNIILKAYLDAIGEKVEYSEEYAVGVKWVNFLMDIRASINSGEIMKANWTNSYRRVKDWALFDAYDPLPAAVDLWLDLRKLF